MAFHVAYKHVPQSGELRPYASKAAFSSDVGDRPALVMIVATDPVSDPSGHVHDIPDGSYNIRGPKGKGYTWTATLVVGGTTYTVT
jgi:hypothetical protein